MDAQLLAALVDEAGRKSDLLWLRYAGLDRARAVWHAWQDGVAYVVAGGGEQPVPGLAEAAEVTVTARAKDSQARLVTWRARAEQLTPGSPEWDTALAALRSERLNATDAANLPDRWASESTITRLVPTGEVLEHPGKMPTDDEAAPPPDSPATTRGKLPWVFHRRPTRGPKLS
ncbi:hypothetical protein [Tenggerimyces flavus]|uniref:Uncharacterized protein n=1 Tax=Tenggerimyces flavus TaxID=1708749 RepID=A0ABV7YEZ3_9ACTN|nr:hypothetical protein [Tenggerimyces flavus]MBM7786035.1 hypothetical protein [Tenggerimyces flavus]